MKPLELASKYLEIFFSGKNLDDLKNLFADNLTFNGPFYKFSSADDYINSLKKDPPKGMKHEIIKSFEDKNSACVIYKFKKGNVSTPMAQLFETENGKLSKMVLIFNSKDFE